MTDLVLTYTGEVTDEGLRPHNPKGFKREVQVFNGKEVVITIRRKRNHRSDQQNRYYWGGVVPIVCEGLNGVGYRITQADTHEYLKHTFLKDKIVNEQTGEYLETIGSTTKLTTTEFMEFIQDIQRWASEFLGVYIPDPNEQTELTLKEN